MLMLCSQICQCKTFLKLAFLDLDIWRKAEEVPAQGFKLSYVSGLEENVNHLCFAPSLA